MEDILESVNRMVQRWVNTATFLTANVSAGATTLNVENTSRFRDGDEITIHDGSAGEFPTILIDSVVDGTTLTLQSPTQHSWTLSQNAMVQKCYLGMFVQGIYIGEQPVIPRYPAIVINPLSESSEWMTFGTTKERRNLEINIYVEQETRENGTRFIMRLAKMIQLGLKKNIFPLVGSYDVVNVAADVVAEDTFLRLESTTGLSSDQLIVLEDNYKAEELRICSVVDSETIEVFPLVHNDFSIDDDAKIIVLHRFLFNSWPSDIQYGTVSKGTLLQGAKIQWFCEEQEVQTRGGWSDPNLS
jgi:hypothetical protein